MIENETYKKIPWVYKISGAFENDILSSNRLDSLPERMQQYFVYKVLWSLSKYFSQIPDHYSEISISDMTDSSKLVKSLNDTLPTWLSGLCDTSISQIITGLVDILSLKTEYQKWPPKSVMEFYAVCKRSRAPYHEFKSCDSKKIEYDRLGEWEKSKQLAAKHLTEIFKNLGLDYAKILAKKNANI